MPLFSLSFSTATYVRDAGVAGSNPATPTIISSTYTFDVFRAQRNTVVRVALIVEKRIPTTDRGEMILLCPRCGGESLHHQEGASYDRGEDAELVIRSVVEGGTAKIDAVPSDGSGQSEQQAGRPVDQGLVRGCKGVDEDILELTISQHKGSTLLGWRYSAKAPQD